jgi:hypothetical protein
MEWVFFAAVMVGLTGFNLLIREIVTQGRK